MSSKMSLGSQVDRRNLKLRNPYLKPLAGLEADIAEIFSRILNVSPVGAEDDFYDLGGDSLLGEEISMEILRVTGTVFPISGLFEHGSPRAIAAHLSAVADSSPGTGPAETFFVVHGRGGYTVPRPSFMSGLSGDARMVTFEFPGIRGDRAFPRSVAEVARVYVEQIEREQPEGPLRLASFCIGALIAIEMAALLRERGRTIAAFVLLDPGMPQSLVSRHRAMTLLSQDPASLAGRMILFLGTGRLSEDRPFLEPLWIRARAAVNMYEAVKKRMFIPRHRLRYGSVGLKHWPRAWLIASYRHSWPPPSDVPCHILASRSRIAGYLDRNGPWQHLLPSREVHAIVDRHGEILGGESAHVAAAMEALLMGGKLDVSTAAAPAAKVTRHDTLSMSATGGPARAVS